jgi:hypothetical protein
MTVRFGVLMAAALALAACEDKPAPVRDVKSLEGDLDEPLPDAIPYSDAIGQPPALVLPPFNLPSYAPVREGARVELSQSRAPSGEPGGVVTFITPETPAAIADFYKPRLEQEFGAVSDATAGRVRLLSARRNDVHEFVEISILPASEGGARDTIAYVLPM